MKITKRQLQKIIKKELTNVLKEIRLDRNTVSDMDAVKKGEVPFYRGGAGTLKRGSAYFISSEMMAGFYGPVSEYRLRLRNPKFVTKEEWGGFDSTMLHFDPSPVEQLEADGYDSAVWVADTPKGKMYTVFALNGGVAQVMNQGTQ